MVLVPIEHLGPDGIDSAMVDLLAERAGWSEARIALLDDALRLYWSRSAALARRIPGWPPPRRRHVAVVREPLAVHPYVQLLNTSAWLLYACDLDPPGSHAEFAAHLLVHGDRMAVSGRVETAAVHAAAYWLERTDEECAAFADAARCSARPDAAAFRALADALPWLRQLRHETLRPLVVLSPHRAIPGTGLLVPRALESEPTALVARWQSAAREAVEAYRATWRASDPEAIDALCEWLIAESPPLLVAAGQARLVWDTDRPRDVGALRAALAEASGVAVRAVADDLRTVARHTRAFHAAVVAPSGLPPPAANTEQRGYTYLHRERRLIAYDLHEPGMERLGGPPLPYARAMLGARTAHEWAHLADAAGWVPRTVGREEFAGLRAELAAELDAAIATAPASVRAQTRADVARLTTDRSAGAALTRILLSRMPDYRANLVAGRFMTLAERETYVRHNIRTLRPEYAPTLLWRMVVRYLYEYQYLQPGLGLSAVAEPHTYFLSSTGFETDVLDAGVLSATRFAALADAVARLCACYAVDESRFHAVS